MITNIRLKNLTLYKKLAWSLVLITHALPLLLSAQVEGSYPLYGDVKKKYSIFTLAAETKMSLASFRALVENEYNRKTHTLLPRFQPQNKLCQIPPDKKQIIQQYLTDLEKILITHNLPNTTPLIQSFKKMINNPTARRVGEVFLAISRSEKSSILDPAGEVFVAFDWLNRKSIEQILAFDFQRMNPRTFHLALSIPCNYACFGCSYGKSKDLFRENRTEQTDIMATLEDMKLYIDKAAEGGVKEIVFSGGGEPLLNPHTIDAMQYAKKKGLHILFFTNGRLLTKEKIRQIMDIEPVLIRISLNAVTPEIYNLFHGILDPAANEVTLNNLKLVCQERQERRKTMAKGSRTEISVAALITPLNISDIPNIARFIKNIYDDTQDGPDRLVIRPMNNFTGTCQKSPNLAETRMYIEKNHPQWANGFNNFLDTGEQFPPEFWDDASDIIKEQVMPVLRETPVRINFAHERMRIMEEAKRPYKKCRGCSLASLIAPNGDIYICLEHSLNSDWRIGNLKENSVDEIYHGELRKSRLKTLHTADNLPCPGSCMNNEYNIVFDALEKFAYRYPDAWNMTKKIIGQLLEKKNSFPALAGKKIESLSEQIYKKNSELKPNLKRKHILCHVIVDALIPDAQKKTVQQLEQEMRKKKYKEKLELINVSSDDPDGFITKLNEEIKRLRDNYEKHGYIAEFDVACTSLEHVNRIQKELNINSLAFERAGTGTFIWIDGIMLALRALYSGKVPVLMEVFELLSEEKLNINLDEIKNVEDFARRKVFKLPKPIDFQQNLDEKAAASIIQTAA